MARSSGLGLWLQAMEFAAEKKGQASMRNVLRDVSSDPRITRITVVPKRDPDKVGRLRRAEGQALVETALALTSLLMALLAGIDIYLYAWDSWRIQEVAREAVAATVDAPSETVARAWLAERVEDQVRAKALRTTLDRVEFTVLDGGGYAPGRTVEVTIQGTHRFQFGMRPLLDEAPVRATAAGLVKRNRNWE
ncbi:MAG: pilus assembly protein [Chloroflexi bacterium]|nr:pilus assembly protein [Chloroflexota bacterium]